MCPPPNEKITRHAAVSAGLSVRGSVRQSHAAVPHPTRIQPASNPLPPSASVCRHSVEPSADGMARPNISSHREFTAVRVLSAGSGYH